MPASSIRVGAWLCATVASASLASLAHADVGSLKAGKANLQSAGALAFGPDGVLFVGDSKAGSIYALDTQDRKMGSSKGVNIQGLGAKVAAALGTTPDQIAINDLAVNPLSKNVYLSVSRGLGPDALPVVLRVDGAGAISELKLDNVKHASVALPNAPAVDAKDRRGGSLRMESITDLAYVDGKLLVAGLSNEEFASNLRVVSYPFQEASRGASIEIFHGAHGRLETNAPIRTFVPYTMGKEANILAAYTCTPLVVIPVAELVAGNKVDGTTIAELGNRNRPLDMIVYKKGGTDHLLMSNSARGVMKMSLADVHEYKGITEQTQMAGLPYETLGDLKGVEQLDRLDDTQAVLLVKNDAGIDLKTIALP